MKNRIKAYIQQHHIFFLAVSFIGLTSFFLLHMVMIFGPGVSLDSTVYIETASNLIQGKGFFVDGQPMTHYPPVYSLLLAVSGFLISDMIEGARFFHAMLFSVNVILVATIAYTLTVSNRLLAMSCAVILFVLSRPIFSIYLWAWSESAFILLTFTSLLCLALYIANRSSLPLLIASSMSVGLAIATRYIGIVLLLPLLIGLLGFSQQSRSRKIVDAIMALLMACIPIGFWLFRNLLMAETATNRSLAIHWMGKKHLISLSYTFSNFVLPMPLPFWTTLLFLTVSLALFIILLWHFYQKHQAKHVVFVGATFVSLNLVFVVSYLAFLFMSISFVDAATPLDDRILSPIFVSLIIIAVIMIASLWSNWRQPAVKLGVFFIFLLVVGLNGFYTVQEARVMQKYGQGYTSLLWQNSETVTTIAQLAPDVRLYSNGIDVFRFWTDREAQRIPNHIFPLTLANNEEYETELLDMCRQIEGGTALFVYFEEVKRWYFPTLDEIERVCEAPLPIFIALDDGVIFGR